MDLRTLISLLYKLTCYRLSLMLSELYCMYTLHTCIASAFRIANGNDHLSLAFKF